MKAWRVYCGWMAYGSIHRLVLAETEGEALTKAAAAYAVAGASVTFGGPCPPLFPGQVHLSAEEVIMEDGVETSDFGE